MSFVRVVALRPHRHSGRLTSAMASPSLLGLTLVSTLPVKEIWVIPLL